MIVQCYSGFQSQNVQKRDPVSPLVPEENMEKHPNMAAHPGAGEASGPQSTAPGQGQGIQISKNVGKLCSIAVYLVSSCSSGQILTA